MILNSAVGVSSLGSAIDYLFFIVFWNKSPNLPRLGPVALSE